MKCRTPMLSFLVLILLMVCCPMFAHHGVSAYDVSKTTTVKATITKFEFSNPHTQIFFDAPDDNGNIVHWVAETINPAMLARVGWTRDSLKPGDLVTLVVNPNKVGARVVLLQKVVLANGQELETKKGF
jgi:uncharacterized protein DUF6152